MSSGSPDQLPQCFLNLNWDHSIDPSSQFGPALISFMSSQSSNSPAPGESFRFGKLGRELQGVGNSSEEISPQPQFMRAPTNSFPIIDLSKLGHVHQHHQAMGELPFAGNPTLENLDQFPADPGFAERAARFSIFDSYRWLASHFELPGNGKPSTVASSQSLKASGLQIAHSESNSEVPVSNGLQLEMNNAELGKAREETSVSDPISASGEACLRDPRGSNAKKRKAHLKAKEKDTNLPKSAIDPPKVSDEEHCSAKTCQSVENNNGTGNDSAKSKSEQNDGVSTNGNGEQKQGKGSNAKPTEPPKDYIHVRARRGQATDSHSLAERVRREKISQRMKLLQDLVPGCSKVTGKAVMLDEIINYVQSLQRQVEFLSMKLATVNPHLDFNNLTNLLPKDMIQTCGPAPNPVYPFERSMATSYANQTQQRNPLHYVATNGMDSHCSMNLLDPTIHQNLSAHQASLNGFGDGSSQLGAFWEDDLQSVVQMGIGHDQEIITSSQNFQGTFPTAQMKIEL